MQGMVSTLRRPRDVTVPAHRQLSGYVVIGLRFWMEHADACHKANAKKRGPNENYKCLIIDGPDIFLVQLI